MWKTEKENDREKEKVRRQASEAQREKSEIEKTKETFLVEEQHEIL